MTERFAYFYFLRSDPDRVRAAVPRHADHWHRLKLTDYIGGPFEDRTGDLITFRADDAQAERAVADDPFVREGLLERYWLKRWSPQ